jgi:protein SCO1/2
MQLPGTSIYNLDISFTDQRGSQLSLGALRGHPVLIAMFYASCTTICPMLIEQIKRIDAALDADARQQTRIVLVTLDPEHDTVDRLAALAASHAIADERWYFARTSPGAVRDTAALLGVAYQAAGGGQFNHSANVVLLNREGEVVMQRQATSVGEIAAGIGQLVAGAHSGPPSPSVRIKP